MPPAPPRRPVLTGLSSPAEENEERMMIDPTSKEDPKFKELVKVRGASVSAFLLGCDEGSGNPRREGSGAPVVIRCDDGSFCLLSLVSEPRLRGEA